MTDPKNPKVGLVEIMKLPREDNVKRIRAIIQNEEGRFLPTTQQVAKRRDIEMDKWHKYVAFNINS